MSSAAATATTDTARAAPADTPGGRRFLLAAASLWKREIVRFLRQRSRVVGALGTPLMFWLVIGAGLGRSFRPDGAPAAGNYMEYFFPGTLLLILLFTAIFSTISIIEDRREGFMQGMLAAPVSRGAIVLGKVLGGATLATLQAGLFLALAPLAGLNLAPADVAGLLATMFVVAFGLTGLGFIIAWPMDSTQGFHAVMNLFLMPLWLLSGALFPGSGASPVLQWVMHVNPLTYNLSLIRGFFYGGATAGGAAGGHAFPLAVTLLFAAGTYSLAWYLACRKTSRPL